MSANISPAGDIQIAAIQIFRSRSHRPFALHGNGTSLLLSVRKSRKEPEA